MFRFQILGLFLFFRLSQPVLSQSIPQPIVPETQPIPLPELLPSPGELLPPFPTPEPPKQPLLEIPGTIIITEFNVVGSTVFTAEEFQSILQDYLNRPLSFNKLLETPRLITQLYREQGYITSGAFLPPQILDQGIVTLEIIEGEVEEIEIKGLKRLHPDYIRSRLEQGIKPPFNQNKLLETLQLLQLNPLIKRFSTELFTGSQLGLSQLEIELEEADALSIAIAIDNQRSPSVGTVRRIVEITHHNLTGWGDQFGVSYYNTEGSQTLDSLSYSLPINPDNGTITLRHRRTNSNIIEAPFNTLDIESQSQTYELSFRQPFYLTPTTEFAMGFTTSIQDSQTFLDQEPFPLSMGADDEGKIRVVALHLFQEYNTRSSKDALAIRSKFSVGLDIFNAKINHNEPDSQFLTWRGQAQYLRLITPDTLWLIRTDLQFSDRSLLPQEQFSLGGQWTVRGYRQDAALGDNGILISTEFRVPFLKIKDWDLLLQFIPFVDWGIIWNQAEPTEVELDSRTLSSFGLGVRLQITENFVAQLDWGIPLIQVETTGESLQEEGIHFSVRYQVIF